jgi:hypothetical protein
VRPGADKDDSAMIMGGELGLWRGLQKLVTGLNPGWWIISTFPGHRTAERNS